MAFIPSVRANGSSDIAYFGWHIWVWRLSLGFCLGLLGCAVLFTQLPPALVEETKEHAEQRKLADAGIFSTVNDVLNNPGEFTAYWIAAALYLWLIKGTCGSDLPFPTQITAWGSSKGNRRLDIKITKQSLLCLKKPSKGKIIRKAKKLSKKVAVLCSVYAKARKL